MADEAKDARRPDEMVERRAPRWAWNILDETLALDAESGAFDPALRADIRRAMQAVVENADGRGK